MKLEILRTLNAERAARRAAVVVTDRYTAFVPVTHDPKLDDPALPHALARDCFYIGARGSKKPPARRIERLKAQGLSAVVLARTPAPIGLAMGAVSPAEIAVAIM